MSTTQTSSVAATGGIVVERLARSFGPVAAVRDVSFEALPGQVTALIGPNGAGKTTLILMLASLLRPDSGTIRISGADPVTDPRAVRSAIGWMPDALGSWDALTVRSAIQTTGRLYGMNRTDAAARADELIRLVGLQELATRATRVLSRGQKQKLSLARALVHDPSVLLLDEPASGLDPLARLELQELVRRLASDGKTVFISSHVLAELDDMADTAVYVNAGVSATADRVAQSKATRRLWRIGTSDSAALAKALGANGFGAEDLDTDRGATIVPVSGEADAAALLTKLVKAGIAVHSFAPAQGDLEHTFLDLSRPTGATDESSGK